MRRFVPFSRHEHKPEYLRQMPTGWHLDGDRGDSLVGYTCAVCAIGGFVLLLWGVI